MEETEGEGMIDVLGLICCVFREPGFSIGVWQVEGYQTLAAAGAW